MKLAARRHRIVLLLRLIYQRMVAMHIDKIFPYEYVGGGYFRRKGVEKGKPAETLHGMEAIIFTIKATLATTDSLAELTNLPHGNH